MQIIQRVTSAQRVIKKRLCLQKCSKYCTHKYFIMADAYLNVALVRFFVILYQIGNLLSIIIQCDVKCCIICLSNKVKYLPKEDGKKKLPKKLSYHF